MTSIQRSDWPILGLVAGLPLYLVRFEILGIPTTLWEISLYAVVLFWFGARRWEWRKVKQDPLLPFLGLIFLASLLSFVEATDLRAALGQWKALIFDAFLLYVLVRQFLPRASGAIERALLLGGSVIAIHGLASWWWGASVVDGRAVGLYMLDPSASPNYLALFLAPLVGLGGGLLFRGWRERGWRLGDSLVGLATLAILAAVFASGSRAGVAVALLAIGWLVTFGITKVWLYLRGWIWGVFVFLILIAGIVFAPQVLPNRLIDEASGGRIVTSNNIRAEIWLVTTLEILPQMPVTGLGLGQFQAVFKELTVGRPNYQEYIAPWALHPHNLFLMHWVSLGFLGLVGWLGLYLRLWQFLKRYLLLVLPAGTALGILLIQGLVDTPYYKNDLAALFMVLAALAVSAGDLGQETKRQSTSSPQSSRDRRGRS